MGVTISADTKLVGDVFETMVGAYYTEKGFDALHAWVQRAFEPVIEAAASAFDHYQCVCMSIACKLACSNCKS